MFSVRGEIDQISTNTSRCTACCAANVYIFVYILIGSHIVPFRYILVPVSEVPGGEEAEPKSSGPVAYHFV